MRKIPAILTGLLSFAGPVYSQHVLDTARFRPAELFALKSGYDATVRLKEIDSLRGRDITVFELAGRSLRIKRSYSGQLRPSVIPGASANTLATVIIVETVDEGGSRTAYFPLTNVSRTRIYLTERMK